MVKDSKYMVKNTIYKYIVCIFALTEPVLHTIRTARGSFFLYSYGS